MTQSLTGADCEDTFRLDTETIAQAFRSLLDTRRSCRAFLDRTVPEAVIREILETAQRAPSWCNAQPWQLIVTSGKETDDFRDFLLTRVPTVSGEFDISPPTQYAGRYLHRRRASGFALYESLGIARDDLEGRTRQAMENYRFFGAPHVAIVTSEADLGPYGYVDSGAYVSSFLLCATSLGVATVAQAAIANYSSLVREYFGLDEDRHVVCGISFGYADQAHPVNGFRTDRASVDEVCEFRGF
jgi:nitroreductase